MDAWTQIFDWLFHERICVVCGNSCRKFIRRSGIDLGICKSCDPSAWDNGEREPSEKAKVAIEERRKWQAIK